MVKLLTLKSMQDIMQNLVAAQVAMVLVIDQLLQSIVYYHENSLFAFTPRLPKEMNKQLVQNPTKGMQACGMSQHAAVIT